MKKFSIGLVIIEFIFISTIVFAQDPQDPKDKDKYFLVKFGWVKAIYDDDLRDYVDNGESVSFGVEKKLTKSVSFIAGVDLMRVAGNYHYSGQRGVIVSYPGEYSPGDTGEHYWGGGTLIIRNSASLRELDMDTTMYLMPVTLGFVRRMEKKSKVTPYVSGSIGYCFARREVDGTAIKEKEYEGPLYMIPIEDTDTENGMAFQVTGGIEIPTRKGRRFIAEAKVSFLDLSDFDAVVEKVLPGYMPWVPPGTTQTFEYYEAPYAFGDLSEVWMLSLMIGVAF